MKKTQLLLVLILVRINVTQAQTGANKIIDVHIHCYEDARFAYPSPVVEKNVPSKNAENHFKETYAALKKANIVKAVISGSPKAVEDWMIKDTEHRFIPGLAIDSPDDYGLNPALFEELVKAKTIKIFGEIGTYYAGTTLADSVWQPYLRLCEKYNIPVAVHLGGGPPETPFHGSPKARLRLSDPFLIEDVLIKYPKLRVYMMHSGEVWYEHAARMMQMYPQLYSDLGVMLWVEPLKMYTLAFLKQAKQSGCLDRVMFGTDQMVWPGATERSVAFLNGLDFLTKKEKEGILYYNAARFLRL